MELFRLGRLGVRRNNMSIDQTAIDKELEYLSNLNKELANMNHENIPVLNLDTLLGDPVEGYEDTYWHVIPEDETKVGYIINPFGKKVPHTLHIPTTSHTVYRKVYKTLVNGEKLPVWEVHIKDQTMIPPVINPVEE